jgi:hypothetical protein
LYERDEAKRLEAKIAAVAADELEQEECDAGETGDDDVDLCSGNLHLLDYRLQTAGRKRTSTKWFYDAQADSKTAESDAKVYERLCLLLDTLIADAERYAHPFNTCGVERFHGERAAICDKRIFYAASYCGRVHFTVCKRLVGWNVLLFVLERLGILAIRAVRERVLELNALREASFKRKSSADYSRRRAELQHMARRENQIRKDLSQRKGYLYKVGAAKCMYTLEQMEQLLEERKREEERIGKLSQLELQAELKDVAYFQWGWKCTCGWVVKGSQSASKVRAHERTKHHMEWSWSEGLTDQVMQCSVCSTLLHVEDKDTHAETHRARTCECGAAVTGNSKADKKHNRTQLHLQWALSLWRFDIVNRCNNCSILHHTDDRAAHAKVCGRVSGARKVRERKTREVPAVLSECNVAELKDKCRNLNIRVSGKKQELISRIEQHLADLERKNTE